MMEKKTEKAVLAPAPHALKHDKKLFQEALQEYDGLRFQSQATACIQKYKDKAQLNVWLLFCQEMNEIEMGAAEKLMLMKLAFRFSPNPMNSFHLAQLMRLANDLLSHWGQWVFTAIIETETIPKYQNIEYYLSIFQYLNNLSGTDGVLATLDLLPDLAQLLDALKKLEQENISKKYPPRDIDTVIERFATTSSPLKREALVRYKEDYLSIRAQIELLRDKPQVTLKTELLTLGAIFRNAKHVEAKRKMVAIIAETMRRCRQMLPYDTQILALLAIMDVPDGLKGRLLEMQTGEGKASFLAMLAAMMASQDYFVNVVTHNEELAMRDSTRPETGYIAFFHALGFNVSHICEPKQKPEHFHAQILYGTRENFKFARLRDGLNKEKLRYSYRLISGQLVPREAEVLLVDEVDNMMLDGQGSALMSIPRQEDILWVYPMLFDYMKKNPQGSVSGFKEYVEKSGKSIDANTINADRISRWLDSAKQAIYVKQIEEDYVIRTVVDHDREEARKDIVIVDFAITGRAHEGSQWSDGLYQLLQVKHELPVSAESWTAASLSNPTYLGTYPIIFGVTGTMGEVFEREEIQTMYQVDSIAIPSHFPSQRRMQGILLLPTQNKQTEVLLQRIKEVSTVGRPILVLFKTIKESNNFSTYLKGKSIKHQLLNETQSEAEDYIVSRAGQAGCVTVATNTAGRGTDIKLAANSKSSGGLHVIFAFYPDNVRVECQGAGRAGRQGEPGSWEMVLHADELDPITKAIFLQKPSLLETTEKIRSVLDPIRLKQNKLLSSQRCLLAQKESLYYKQLEYFFTVYQRVLIETNEAAFQARIIDLCKQPIVSASTSTSTSTKLPLIDVNAKHWRPVLNALQFSISRRHHQHHLSNGNTLDAFIQQFRQAYLDEVRQSWAEYYSGIISNSSRMESLAQIDQTMQNSFASSKASIYLSQPMVEIEHCLQSLLDKILNDKAHSMVPSEHVVSSAPNLFAKRHNGNGTDNAEKQNRYFINNVV
jgi:preprotein translocase subunit SecA